MFDKAQHNREYTAVAKTVPFTYFYVITKKLINKTIIENLDFELKKEF